MVIVVHFPSHMYMYTHNMYIPHPHMYIHVYTAHTCTLYVYTDVPIHTTQIAQSVTVSVLIMLIWMHMDVVTNYMTLQCFVYLLGQHKLKLATGISGMS